MTSLGCPRVKFLLHLDPTPKDFPGQPVEQDAGCVRRQREGQQGRQVWPLYWRCRWVLGSFIQGRTHGLQGVLGLGTVAPDPDGKEGLRVSQGGGGVGPPSP